MGHREMDTFTDGVALRVADRTVLGAHRGVGWGILEVMTKEFVAVVSEAGFWLGISAQPAVMEGIP